jgi:hypothetical protein
MNTHRIGTLPPVLRNFFIYKTSVIKQKNEKALLVKHPGQ